MPKKKSAVVKTTDDFLTRAQAAQELGVSVRTIDRMIQRGELERVKTPVIRGRGGVWYFIPRAGVEKLKTAMVIQQEKQT